MTSRAPDFRKRAAVFLDRDGTLNAAVVRAGRPYPPASVEEFALLPGVAEGCARLKAAGYVLVVVTNQPDVGRGIQSQTVVEAIHTELRRLLPIDRVEVSYSSGRENPPSPFRKPAPGLLLRAACELDLDLGRSWMVGDRWRDVDCGRNAGCRTVLIDRGYAEALRAQPDFTVRDFTEAVEIILTESKSESESEGEGKGYSGRLHDQGHRSKAASRGLTGTQCPQCPPDDVGVDPR